MSETEFVFTDRYQALGIPYPDPATMCKGPCEGIGFYPLHRRDVNSDYERAAWTAQSRKERLTLRYWWHRLCGRRSMTDWMFVRCPDCGGTGFAHPSRGAGEAGR